MQIRFQHDPAPKVLEFKDLEVGRVYEWDGKWYLRCTHCLVCLNNGSLKIDDYWCEGNGRDATFLLADVELVVKRKHEVRS